MARNREEDSLLDVEEETVRETEEHRLSDAQDGEEPTIFPDDMDGNGLGQEVAAENEENEDEPNEEGREARMTERRRKCRSQRESSTR